MDRENDYPSEVWRQRLAAVGIPRQLQDWTSLTSFLPAACPDVPDIDALADLVIYLREKSSVVSSTSVHPNPLKDLKTGSHLCLWYEDPRQLLDWLVPYFEEGLHAGDYCLWNVSPPLDIPTVRQALAERVGPLEAFAGQLAIVDADDLYLDSSGAVKPIDQILDQWALVEQAARNKGFNRLRATGDTAVFQSDASWKAFVDYECKIHQVIRGSPIMAVCTYDLSKASPRRVAEALEGHAEAIFPMRYGWRKAEVTEEARARLPHLIAPTKSQVSR